MTSVMALGDHMTSVISLGDHMIVVWWPLIDDHMTSVIALGDHMTVVWLLLQEEIEKRKDFRGECVFSIDPETARVSHRVEALSAILWLRVIGNWDKV